MFDLLNDGEFVSHLTLEEYDFLEDLADYIRTKGKPPPLRASSHVLCAGLFYVPETVSVDAPEGGEDGDFFSYEDFQLQEDVLRLIDGGEDNIWKLDICLPEDSLGDIVSVVDRLIGLDVITDDNGNLSLNYAEPSLKKFAPTEKMAPIKGGVFNVSREIVRLVGSGISDRDFLRGHFPTVPTRRFSTVMDKLIEDGTVIRQPDGELVLGR